MSDVVKPKKTQYQIQDYTRKNQYVSREELNQGDVFSPCGFPDSGKRWYIMLKNHWALDLSMGLQVDFEREYMLKKTESFLLAKTFCYSVEA